MPVLSEGTPVKCAEGANALIAEFGAGDAGVDARQVTFLVRSGIDGADDRLQAGGERVTLTADNNRELVILSGSPYVTQITSGGASPTVKCVPVER